jgi:hypothetical protein
MAPFYSQTTQHSSSNAASADTADKYGDAAGEAMTPEQEERIRRLLQQGVSEKWARRAVLAEDHALGCECEVCL